MPRLPSLLRRKPKRDSVSAAPEVSRAPESATLEPLERSPSDTSSPTEKENGAQPTSSSAGPSTSATGPSAPPVVDKVPFIHQCVLYDSARNPLRIAYHHKGAPNFWLSPDSDHPVYLDDVRYPTAEHLFQALKFPAHPAIAQKVRRQNSPQDARRVAHEHSAYVERGWMRDRLNVAAMDKVLLLKFTQHSDLMLRLLDTGDALIVYATAGEVFWGAGVSLAQLESPGLTGRGQLRGRSSATERAARAQKAAQQAAAARSQSREHDSSAAHTSPSEVNSINKNDDVPHPRPDTDPLAEANHTEDQENLDQPNASISENGLSATGSDLGASTSPGPEPVHLSASSEGRPSAPTTVQFHTHESPERNRLSLPRQDVRFSVPAPPTRQRLHTPAVQSSFRGKNEQGKALMRTRELLRAAAGLGWGSATRTI